MSRMYTRDPRAVAASLRHLANLFSDVDEFVSPVYIGVSIYRPNDFTNEVGSGLALVDQVASSLDGSTPTWDSSTSSGGYGWYSTGRDEGLWHLTCSVRAKLPDPTAAEVARLEAELAQYRCPTCKRPDRRAYPNAPQVEACADAWHDEVTS